MSIKRRPPKNNVRRVRTNTKNRWGVMTNHQCETTQFESDYEWILQAILLRDQSVETMISQPIEIHYQSDDGKKHKYTPDLKIVYKNGEIVIAEFSIQKRREDIAIQRRERAGQEFCEEKGWEYKVITEQDLPSPVEIENIKMLYGYMPKAYFQEDIGDEIIYQLIEGGPLFISEIVENVANELGTPKPKINNTLFHMMWNKVFFYTPNQLLFIDGTPNRKIKAWI